MLKCIQQLAHYRLASGFSVSILAWKARVAFSKYRLYLSLSTIDQTEINCNRLKHQSMISKATKRKRVLVFFQIIGILAQILIVLAILQQDRSKIIEWIVNGLIWIFYLFLCCSSLRSVSNDLITSIDKYCFSSLLLLQLVFLGSFVQDIVVTKPATLPLIFSYNLVSASLLIAFKLSLNESRFLTRLISNDVGPKEMRSSWYSRVTFSFVDDLVAIAAEKSLDMDDLDELLIGDTSIVVCKKFESLKREDRSLLMTIYLVVRREFLWQQLATLISTITVLGGPLLLKSVLDYLADQSSVSSPIIPYLYALALFIVTMVKSIADGQTFFLGRRIGLRIRAVLISLIYTKSLKKIAVVSDGLPEATGNVTNLMSVDATKILEVCSYLMFVWSTPAQSIICILFLLKIAGLPALGGLAVMILCLPLAIFLGNLLQQMRKKLMVFHI